MKQPFFSIVIATYNSEKTIEYTLQSIFSQSVDKSEVEILVVDGGSTDKTLSIAKNYNVLIFDNPKKLPEYAKAIGMRNANGHYIIRMDSDEEFSHISQLQEKMDFLKKHPDLKMLIPNQIISGRKNICGISADYMNILGDPFSYFVYRTKIDKCETYKKNIIFNDGKYNIMRFKNEDIYPLADSATSLLSLDFIRLKYPEEYDSVEFTCGAYDRVIQDTELWGCIKGDNIKHNCSSSFRVYLSKLRFRVINNLFHKEESGFSSKEKMNNCLTGRKLLFCLYAVLFPLPILDSFRLAIVYRNSTFLLHFIYLYYVCFQIGKGIILKIFGKEIINSSYGQ